MKITSTVNPYQACLSGLQAGLLCLLLVVACGYAATAFGKQTTQPTEVSAGLKARNLQFSQISQQHGLSQGAVNAIAQDRYGFIWLGTQEGLNRYDGYDMVVYEHKSDDPASLSHDWIWSAYVDNSGTLWVGTDGGGLNRYDRELDAFTRFQHVPDDPHSLSNNRVRVIYQDRQGYYWIGTDGGGLNRFDASNGRFTRYRHDDAQAGSLPNDKVLAIFEDSRGKLWVGTEAGLARMDHAREKFVVYRHNPSVPDSLSNDQVRSVYEDRRGQLWIGTYKGGLNLFDRNTGGFRHFQHEPGNPHSLAHNRVRSIFEDHESTLWVATDNGLNEWRQGSHAFVRYSHDPSRPSSISDNRVTTIFQDAGNILWVGTFNGVNKWNYVSDAFRYLQDQGGARSELSGNVITAIKESADGVVWVGTYGAGLNRVDLKTGQTDQFRHAPADTQSLSDDRVMALFVEEDGGVWVGTRNGGLNHLDPESGKFTHHRHNPDKPGSLSSDAVSSIFGENNGILWVGTYGAGLNRLDTGNGDFSVYRHDPDNATSISSDRILNIVRDRSGMLWVGTEDGGLNRLDEDNQSFSRYQHDPDNEASLASNAAWNIMEDKDGALWIATLGGGLNRWDISDRSANQTVFRKYQKADGLKSDTVFGVLEDADGFLWLSTNRGLSRLNPQDGTLRHFDRFNGLQGDEFNFGAHLKTNGGHLLFGGTDGLVTLDPELLRVNMHRPDVVLSAHSRYQQLATVYSSEEKEAETIELGYDDDFIRFRFAALDYASSDKNHYRYRLDGFDDEWIDPGQVRSATYTSLPAGDYTFTVKAANNDGVWNERGATLQLHVAPPPWQTPWAYSLYTFFFGGTFVKYRRSHNRKLDRASKHSAALESEVKARTRQLSERNDELRAANDKLREASVTDALTGLKNRRYFYESVKSMVASVGRRAQGIRQGDAGSNTVDIAPSMFFMMIDLDGFKVINDTYGHEAGDRALVQVRDVLESSCRTADTIIRWGGDEFMIVGDNTSSRAAEQLAERLRGALAAHKYQLGGGHVGRLSGSIGFAMYPFSPLKKSGLLTWEQVVAVADHAAYTAKKNGRNAWVGVYGTRKSLWADFTKNKIDLASLAKQGMVNIRSSLHVVSEFRQQTKQGKA
ncbi:MAG: two-component regulator propeller domain-containing protein [Thiogranum sp.]